MNKYLQKVLKLFTINLSFPLFFCIAYLIKMFGSDYRFGIIVSAHIGHLCIDTEAALLNLSRSHRDGRIWKVILVTQPFICNHYMLKLLSKASYTGIELSVSRNFLIYSFCRFLQKTQYFNSLLIKTYSLTDHWAQTIASPVCISLPKEDIDLFQTWIRDNPQLNKDSPCIILHNRDAAYRPDALHNSYRDFSPSVFHSIIEKYSAKYNFLRVGRLANQPLPSRSSGCVDLPFSKVDDRLEVMCHAAALFYFGSDSGVKCISHALRKPTAGICYSPNSFGYLRKISTNKLGFIPKRMVWDSTGVPIGLIEMYEKNLINFSTSSEFERAGIRLISNSEDEVLEFFEEVLLTYSEGFKRDSIETPQQEEFWRIVTHYETSLAGGDLISERCFIGSGFLNRNPYLFAH